MSSPVYVIQAAGHADLVQARRVLHESVLRTQSALDAVPRKRSWRPSERAMAVVEYQRRLDVYRALLGAVDAAIISNGLNAGGT